ncbi:hypothetical protein [Halalkalibacterium halodurans]|uniref:Uncharacterized protein n=1 Tax=Halalkalibacterium halodurans TaxID=86665 RepID=A0A0M0KH66_ALKHA|nr:hypothetical protein [Halalkalibacterium halodurans]TPE68350.1 hypothetical protein AMD02_014120 [Halalkalibacterium halodurans]
MQGEFSVILDFTRRCPLGFNKLVDCSERSETPSGKAFGEDPQGGFPEEAEAMPEASEHPVAKINNKV